MGNISGKESEAARQRRLEWERGVLVPPSFISASSSVLTTAGRASLEACPTPSLVQYLWELHRGRQFFQNHIKPGVALCVQASPHTNVVAASSGVVELNHAWQGNAVTFKATALQDESSTKHTQPSIQASCNVIPHRAWLHSQMGADGRGWIGSRFNASSQDSFALQFGSWVDLDLSKRNGLSGETLGLYGAAELKKSLLAVEATVPLTEPGAFSDKAMLPDIDAMLSLDINDNGTSPLWVTVLAKQRDAQTDWALNLHQTATFDGVVFDIIDERALKVRQTVSWSVQLEKDQRLQLGAAWQLNRAVAVKGVFNGDGKVDTSLILRCWEQPGITLSVFNSFQLKSKALSHSFVGFGLEVEQRTYDSDTAEYPGDVTARSSESPKTKVVVS